MHHPYLTRCGTSLTSTRKPCCSTLSRATMSVRLTASPAGRLYYSLTLLITADSVTHSLTHSPTHPLTHPLTHCRRQKLVAGSPLAEALYRHVLAMPHLPAREVSPHPHPPPPPPPHPHC